MIYYKIQSCSVICVACYFATVPWLLKSHASNVLFPISSSYLGISGGGNIPPGLDGTWGAGLDGTEGAGLTVEDAVGGLRAGCVAPGRVGRDGSGEGGLKRKQSLVVNMPCQIPGGLSVSSNFSRYPPNTSLHFLCERGSKPRFDCHRSTHYVVHYTYTTLCRWRHHANKVWIVLLCYSRHDLSAMCPGVSP
jgi:hypothetical protein